MEYTLTPKEFTTLKSRLTRVVNTKNHEKIIEECDRAFEIFEKKGYPDNWSDWQRAKTDAEFALQMQKSRW